MKAQLSLELLWQVRCRGKVLCTAVSFGKVLVGVQMGKPPHRIVMV